MKTVAIIGAGPSGLVAAKEAVAAGLEPTVFESSPFIGGLWRPDGYTWPGMRTNISKWNCAFSDFAWSEVTDAFPTGAALHAYLLAYADEHNLKRYIQFDSSVTHVMRAGNGWQVTVADNPQPFDAMIVASGIFAKPFMPFPFPALHSSAYRGAQAGMDEIVVAGGAMSGVEIAADLAAAGRKVRLVTNQPCWILPRVAQLNGAGVEAPLDLLFNRIPAPDAPVVDSLTRNIRMAAMFANNFHHMGQINPSLTPLAEGRPQHVAISNGFMDQVARGNITLHAGKVTGFEAGRVTTDTGETLHAYQVIACTGYEADMGFLGESERKMLAYDPQDKFMPFLAQDAVHHPDLPGLFFVGVYRGPYFGVMELQARMAAGIISGAIAIDDDSIAGMQQLRHMNPRPQFPFGYMPLAHRLASQLGVIPEVVTGTPIIPALYRLEGHGAAPTKALPALQSAAKRIGFDL